MKHFFDSSLLVSAFDDQDVRHEAARHIFVRHAEDAALATHTLAETFSILTGRRAWGARDAFEVLRVNTAPMEKIALSPGEYLHVMEEAERSGVRGGAIYDALILACARKAKAEAIWTLNARHFLLFAKDLSGKIREP